MHRHLLPEINRIFRSHRFHDMTGRRQSRPAAIAILPTIDHNGRAPEPISPGRCTVFPLSTGCFNQNLHSGDAQPAPRAAQLMSARSPAGPASRPGPGSSITSHVKILPAASGSAWRHCWDVRGGTATDQQSHLGAKSGTWGIWCGDIRVDGSRGRPPSLIRFKGPVPAPSTGLGGWRFSSTGRSSASTEIGWPSTNLHWWRQISTARRAG